MHRQAIVTKWHGPTNHLGSRVSAKASAGKVVVHWDHALNIQANHARAAKALAEKLGWGGHWVSGGMPSEDGDVFVCAMDRYTNERDALHGFEPAFSTEDREV